MSRTCVGHALPTQIDFDAKETGIDPEPGEMARDKAVQVIDDLARVSRGRDFLPDEAVDAASEQGRSDTMTGHVADAEKELVVVRFEKAAVIASEDVMFLERTATSTRSSRKSRGSMLRWMRCARSHCSALTAGGTTDLVSARGVVADGRVIVAILRFRGRTPARQTKTPSLPARPHRWHRAPPDAARPYGKRL